MTSPFSSHHPSNKQALVTTTVAKKNSQHAFVLFSMGGPRGGGGRGSRPPLENHKFINRARVAQSVTCLVTDAKLTADPGVASSIPARSHTFVKIDHEIISTVILLPSAESFMKVCCQLQAKVCARLLVNCLFKLAQEKSVVK